MLSRYVEIYSLNDSLVVTLIIIIIILIIIITIIIIVIIIIITLVIISLFRLKRPISKIKRLAGINR